MRGSGSRDEALGRAGQTLRRQLYRGGCPSPLCALLHGERASDSVILALVARIQRDAKQSANGKYYQQQAACQLKKAGTFAPAFTVQQGIARV
jgi:hypothetical protein